METNGNGRPRWTDERLDRLADSVAELREGLAESKDSIDGLRVTCQALLQIAAQNQQAEQEHREENRLINERLDVQQGQIRILLERLLSGG
jgi:hypothetical protein